MKTWIKVFLLFVSVILLAELTLRFAVGLGELPVYIEDKDFEYIYAPNQKVKRFGNAIITNEFSMRSRSLSKGDKARILKIGDSIINGGAQISHDSLSSTILEKQLSLRAKDSIRVLNVGANSWGPDNAFAYLEKFGHFDASLLVWVISSHDLYDHRHFQKVVNVHPSWPGEQPFCAISDAFSKYLLPGVKNLLFSETDFEYRKGFGNKQINPGFQKIFEYTTLNSLPVLVYLHPTLKEIEQGSYNDLGKRIIHLLEENDMSFLLGIEYGFDSSFYLDGVHLNNKGHRRMAEVLYPQIAQTLKNKNSYFSNL
jgi:hypothetical protein